MEDLVQRSSLMDVQKDSLDLCPDVISPVGGRLLNAPLCKCLCTEMASRRRKRVNRTQTQIPPVPKSNTCNASDSVNSNSIPHHPMSRIN